MIWEPKARTQDLGEIQSPVSMHAPVPVSGYLHPVNEVPFRLWAEGKIILYEGPQYHSSYLPQRARYLMRGETRTVVWSIHHPGRLDVPRQGVGIIHTR